MSVISLRIDDSEEQLIKSYAKANNITVSSLFKNAVLEKIEDEIDLNIYNKVMNEQNYDSQNISFDKMLEALEK